MYFLRFDTDITACLVNSSLLGGVYNLMLDDLTEMDCGAGNLSINGTVPRVKLQLLNRKI